MPNFLAISTFEALRSMPMILSARTMRAPWMTLIEIDPLITHVMPLDEINTAFDLMHEGKSIRSVVVYRKQMPDSGSMFLLLQKSVTCVSPCLAWRTREAS